MATRDTGGQSQAGKARREAEVEETPVPTVDPEVAERVEKITGKHETSVNGDASNTFKAKLTDAITGDYTATCDANVGIEAKGSTLTLKCGAASITLHSGGKIEIKGTDLVVDASASVKVGAGSDLEMSGAKFELGATGGGTVKAGATLDLKGTAMVNIN